MTVKQHTTSTRSAGARWNRGNRAFTLLEVMIAAGIFFMAIFAILELVSSNIRNARRLQETGDAEKAAMVLADFVQTNKLYEGSVPVELDSVFPGYSAECDVTLVGTNGLFKVDCIVTKPGGGPNAQTTVSTMLFRPDSPKSTP